MKLIKLLIGFSLVGMLIAGNVQENIPSKVKANELYNTELSEIREVIFDFNDDSWYILANGWAIQIHGGEFDSELLENLNEEIVGKTIQINYSGYDTVESWKILD